MNPRLDGTPYHAKATHVGPLKLIMIDSAVYRYVEVPLDAPVHLAGDNNVGKTTLINALQYFYLDAASRHFPRKAQEAQQWYFKEHSYLLLEVESPTGIKVIGAFADPQKTGGIQYFVFEEPYEKALFMDPETNHLRDRVDVIANLLATRRGKLLDPSQLRNAMSGEKDNQGVRLDLIPTTKYNAFARVFKHLLSLRATKDSDLKQMILDSIQDLRTPRWVLDLPRVCGDIYTEAKAEQAKLARLSTVKPIWERLAISREIVQQIEAALPTQWSRLVIAAEAMETSLRRREEGLEEALRNSEEEELVLRRRKAECKDSMGEAQKEVGIHGGELQRLENQNQQLSEQMADDLLVAENESLQLDLDELREDLRLAGSGKEGLEGRRQLESRVRETERAIDRERARLEDPSLGTWGMRILSEYSKEEQGKLLKLFNPNLLGLPEGEGGMTIQNESALHDFLSRIVASGGPDTFESKAFWIDLRSLVSEDKDFCDPLAGQQQIERWEAQLEKDRQRLKGISDIDGKRRIQDQVQKRMDYLVKELASRAIVREAVKAIPEIRERLETLEIRLKAAQEAFQDADSYLESMLGRRNDLNQELEKTRRDLNRVRMRMLGDLRRVGDNEGLTLLEIGQEDGLGRDELENELGKLAKDLSLLATHRESLQADLKVVEEQLGGIDGRTDTDRLAAIDQEMSALPGLVARLKDRWATMVSHAARGFYDLNGDLKRVAERVDVINRKLNRTKVSNLRGITIQMVTEDGVLGPIREWLSTSEIPLIEKERLADAQAVLAGYLEQGRQFKLEDLFSLRIDVRRVDGTTESYQSLEAESTGTGITLKIVLLSILLRNHLVGKEHVVLPLFVDEVNTLDDRNREAVLACARDLRFRVVMAAPHAVPADHILFLHSIGGRTIVRERESLHLKLKKRAMASDTEPMANVVDSTTLAIGAEVSDE